MHLSLLFFEQSINSIWYIISLHLKYATLAGTPQTDRNSI